MIREYIIKISDEVMENECDPDRPQELVRCRDCKHSDRWYGDKRRCFLWNETGVGVFVDGFCNYGKRLYGVKRDNG